MGQFKTTDDIIEELLKSRGLTKKGDRDSFLKPDYDSQLHDPYLFKDMDVAVERIVKAQKEGETVGVFGDYDIDGLTATTLLNDAFSSFGIEVVSHIPNRFIEGYGMSKDGLDALKEQGASVVVTVDCGSTSVDEIDYANLIGLDVIVTDHHEAPKKLPKALAVINHKRADNTYPFDELAGVGVAFKLVQALQQKLDGLPEGQEKWLLDLVALGTVCDVVNLTDENRTLVYWGTEVMKQTRRQGIHALAATSKAKLPDVSATTFGFVFGPRLNASGRLETARLSLDLLMSDDLNAAQEKAVALEDMNNNRREQQKHILEEAEKQARSRIDDSVLILDGEGWAEGVIGIVASKIMEKFKKPVFMIARLDDGKAKGSARSFGDFSIVEAIRANEDLLIKGGGHKFAGGLTIEQDKIEDFRKGVNEFYKSLKLEGQAAKLDQSADVELEDSSLANLDLIKKLEKLAPFGMGNPEPVFRLKDQKVFKRREVGSDGQHLKLTLSDKHGQRLDAIGFGMGSRPVAEGDVINPLVRIEGNTFNGVTNPQAKLISI